MSKPYQRLGQIAEALSREISVFLQKEIGEKYGLITCARVELDNDLKNGVAYISSFPPLDKSKKLDAVIKPTLKDMMAYVKKQVPAKWLPHLEFQLDESEKEANRIYGIMDKI